jgi:hypothetical protein
LAVSAQVINLINRTRTGLRQTRNPLAARFASFSENPASVLKITGVA